MTSRRRALVLAGLAILLGGLAASDVAGREAALRDRLGPTVSVLVLRSPLPKGRKIAPDALGRRAVPARYAPPGALSSAQAVIGLRTAVSLPAGADVTAAVLDDGTGAPPSGAPVRPGERVAEIVARGSPAALAPGSRVDVLVTREPDGGGGATELALEDAEVLAVAAPPAGGEAREGDGGPRVALSLRVTLRQAVYLAAAQSFARELRVLPRAAGDRHHERRPLRVGAGL